MGVRGGALGLLALVLLTGWNVPDPSDAERLRALYSGPVSTWPAPTIDDGIDFVEFGALELKSVLDAGKAALGRRLFHDPTLSRTGDKACASCHDANLGWSDGRPVAAGMDPARGARNVPSLFSAAYRREWGWDGRGSSLATQSLRPLTHPDEMANADVASVVSRLGESEAYRSSFAAIYGDPTITADRLADALAAFQSGLEEPTRFDAFLRGDSASLSDQEIRGLHLFRTKARCANCHIGPLLTDERFHNLGLSAFREKSQDLGRHLVTGRPEHAGQFRTPSLRHVARTAPYMHSGLFASLAGVVNFYARGGGDVWARNAREAQAPLYREAARIATPIRPLDLDTGERAALVAFLNAI
ncbi:cytochrome-c peroxidase [Starkeya sp. ORNL1]|uniref:cytochrome-c peroxidase n=1 Tax=Starkeya sp. ORNL1 TaxID=2709380 RepID=UPI001462D723|nr:cytochrome c peroxidase [Starkeya sp. ORNL1]QJP15791.1 cytochrome-c peroxidase [Starkeya sp. ORNL1]